MFKLNLFKGKGRASGEKENLFIHIPKAGGSTFVGLLKDSQKLTEAEEATPTHMIEQVGETRISHIRFGDEKRLFKEPQVFDPENISRYQASSQVFCLVRDPVDRITSEFNFQYHILGGKEGNYRAAIYFKLKGRPSSVMDYAKFKEVRNYQVKFLLGRDIADASPVKAEEFDRIIRCMEELPVHLGVTDKYTSFLNMFSSISGVKLKSKVTVRKQTPIIHEPFLSDAEREQIRKWNVWDQKLYQFACDRVASLADGGKDRYTYKNSDSFIV